MMQSTESTRALVSLEDVSLSLYGREMFVHTNWEIREGQHWAIIGPNGSGKSTLVRALCGHVPVVGGRIVYHLDDGSPGEKTIAHVAFDVQERTLQHSGQFHQARWNVGPGPSSQTVSEYLSEWQVREVNPYQVVEEQAAPAEFATRRKQVVELLGIAPLLSRDLVQLSNGERRQVTLARALLKDPRLLILDNPFGGLDSQFRIRLRQVIEGLMRDGVQVMVVTTRTEEVPPGITHVLWVDRYQVIAQGVWSEPLEVSDALGPDPTTPCKESEPEGPVLVQMAGVCVVYHGISILWQVDWTIRRGEHWALLGPNGSGKTTLLSLILGDHPQAYANNVTLFGRRRGTGESIWEIKQQIGWVSPELQLYYPKRTRCLDVVCSGFFDSVGLYERPTAAQQAAAGSWLAHLGMSAQAQTPLAALSEGEQRIVLLARALVKQPALLILDEPCQGLDKGNRCRVLQAVDQVIGHTDAGLVYVTHDIDELPQAITHRIHLEGGRVTGLYKVNRFQDAAAAQQRSWSRIASG